MLKGFTKQSVYFLMLSWMGLTPLVSQVYFDPTNTMSQLDTYRALDYVGPSLLSLELLKGSKKHRQLQDRISLTYGLMTNRPYADLFFQDFQEKYVNLRIEPDLTLAVANYNFDKGNYGKAMEYYSRLEGYQLSTKTNQEVIFNHAYSLFRLGRNSEALAKFQLVNLESPLAQATNYYSGHIYYLRDDFSLAKNYFNRISEQSPYKEKVLFFEIDKSFREGDFTETIQLGKEALTLIREQKQLSEVNKLIGDSYFNLERYNESIPYLKEFKGTSKGIPDEHYYQLGYAYYRSQEYGEAIKRFNKIITRRSPVSQSAFYFLADCYLQSDRKSDALNSFRVASQLNQVTGMAEDARLQYAKLSYQIGNPFEAVSTVLIDFLRKYPSHSNRTEIEHLLYSSFANDENYDIAIEYLKETNSLIGQYNLQKIYLLKGQKNFNNGFFKEAISSFEKASEINSNAIFKNIAHYWRGRGLYEIGQYYRAIEAFSKFQQNPISIKFEENQRVNYDIAYSYFKLEDYPKAVSFFIQQLNSKQSNSRILSDTYLRLGDSYYVQNEFEKAIDSYTESSNRDSSSVSYALFQIANSHGFLNDIESKTSVLQNLIEEHYDTDYADDAIVELAETYERDGNLVLATNTYDRLIFEFPSSPFLPLAMLNKGLIQYNSSQFDEAEYTLKKLVEEYVKGDVTAQAIQILREIAIEKGEFRKYSRWAQSNGLDSIDQQEVEKVTFESAERSYLQGNDSQSLHLFLTYLNSYPNGLYAVDANFYVAEIYYRGNLIEEALERYLKVVEAPNGNQSEKSLVRAVQIHRSKNNFQQIVVYSELLNETALVAENKLFAKQVLMSTYFALENFDKASQMSIEVLDNENINQSMQTEALLINARSFLALKDSVQAELSYAKLESSSDSEIIAESLYYRANRHFIDVDYDKTIEAINQLSSLRGSKGKWGVKSLILLSTVYLRLDDPFQAKFVLESVIQNHATIYPELVVQAENLLENLSNQ